MASPASSLHNIVRYSAINSLLLDGVVVAVLSFMTPQAAVVWRGNKWLECGAQYPARYDVHEAKIILDWE